VRRTRIKICGITSVEAAQVAVDAGADAIGLVFAEGSPRRIEVDQAAEIVQRVPPMVTIFGVFQLAGGVHPDLESWRHLGDWVQLHGDESEAVAKSVSRRFHVIKGFSYDSKQLKRWDHCPSVRMLLVDGGTPGGGKGFRHAKLARLMDQVEKPVALAGGLTPDNVIEAIRTVRPFAVDVSSGVESKPGVKDPDLIHAFCDAVRAADAQGE